MVAGKRVEIDKEAADGIFGAMSIHFVQTDDPNWINQIDNS